MKQSININPEHKGLLHRDTNTPSDQPISEKKLQVAKHSEDPAVRRRANFAENAKHWSGR